MSLSYHTHVSTPKLPNSLPATQSGCLGIDPKLFETRRERALASMSNPYPSLNPSMPAVVKRRSDMNTGFITYMVGLLLPCFLLRQAPTGITLKVTVLLVLYHGKF